MDNIPPELLQRHLPKSRPLDRFIDAQGARRLLLMWVPAGMSRWCWYGWGFRAGRLWVQWTPPSPEEIERLCREKTRDVSVGSCSQPV